MLQLGKLYFCSGYYLILYPDKEVATAASANGFGSSATAAEDSPSAASFADFWSRKLGKLVSYYSPRTPLLILSMENEFVEVLAGDKKGWIIFKDWLNIKEVR